MPVLVRQLAQPALCLQAVEATVWQKPPSELPDAHIWPTWGALRERVLSCCKQILTDDTLTVRDAFPAELVKLSPPDLHTLSVRPYPPGRQACTGNIMGVNQDRY